MTLLLVGAVLVGLTAPADATVLTGSLRTAFYTQQSRQGALPYAGLDQHGELQSRTQFLESVRLDARQLGVDWLSFHTAFTATNVLTDQSIGETRFRLHRVYLQRRATLAGMTCESRLGRHWVSTGVGSGILDGLSAGLRPTHWGEVTAYFGTLGTDRIIRTDKFWDLDAPDESRAFGGRVRVEPRLGIFRPRFAVSYRQTQRTPNDELVTDSRLLGLHLDLRFDRDVHRGSSSFLQDLRLWGDLKRDLLGGLDRSDQRNISLTVGGDYLGARSGVSAFASYERRRPDLRATSFFASFDPSLTQRVRAGFAVPMGSTLRLGVDGDLVAFKDDESEQGIRFLVSAWGLSLGYRLHRGYGGDLSGFVFSGHREITEKLSLDAHLDFSSYEYGTLAGDDDSVSPVDDTATAAMLGATYLLRSDLSLTGRIEGMENAAFDHDVRFLAYLNWRFRTRL